jgi:aminopeptidase N
MPREFALPGTRPKYARDRVVDVEHLRLVLDVDPAARRITGVAHLSCTAIAPKVRWVELDAAELVVTGVRVDGDKAAFAHDGHRLRIHLGGELAAGDRLDLAVEYAGTPRRGLYFVAPDAGYPDKPLQVWSQGQDEDSRYWFPCFDQPHEKATTEVVVTVPARLFALSNGELQSDKTEGDRRTLHWRLDVPHSCYLVTLAIGDLATIEHRWRDVAVSYHVARGREDDAARTLARTVRMLEVFSERFGVDYPYTRYAQVFVADFIFGGMENTTATTLTDQVLLDERAALDHDVDALVSHELAHQWFGDLVTCRDWGEGWLNEGFATYAEYVWREAYEGRDAADLELTEWGDAYFGEDSGRYRRTIATKLYDEPIDIFDHHLYEKGGRVLHMMRQILGENAFWSSLRHYLTKHRHGSVETRDLARAVEEATGRVLDWFFSQWVTEGAGHPELAVSFAWDPDQHLATVTVRQTQKVEGPTPLFRLPAVLRFRVAGHDVDEQIELTDDRHVFHVRLPSEPTQAIFDPGRTLLAQYRIDKSLSLWTGQLAHATFAIDRIAAARALADKGGSRAEEALTAALREDPFWAVRGGAAAGLGALRTDRARDALVAALAAEQHPRARRAIVKALGDFRDDGAAIRALEEVVVRGDPSYFVEAEACLSLGRTRAESAPRLLRDAAGRPAYGDVIRQHAYRGLAEARDDSAVPLLVEATGWGRPTQGRRAAAQALAHLVRGRHDRDARDVREHLERLLEDRDFRVQAAAIEALAVVGDAAAVGALRTVIVRELDGRLRRRAAEVIRDLEERRGTTEEVGKLRDELGQLRDVVARLRDQVERIQLEAAHPRASRSERPSDKAKKKGKPAKKDRKSAKAKAKK